MPSTADRLNLLLNTKKAIKNAIIEKGVDVADTDPFSVYPDKIAEIPFIPKDYARAESDWGVLYLDNGRSDETVAYTLTENGWNSLNQAGMFGQLDSGVELEYVVEEGKTAYVWADKRDIVGFDFGNHEMVNNVNDSFLSGCHRLNHLTFGESSHITFIGSYFLRDCVLFNRPLTIPNGVTNINDYFLYGCTMFNSPLTFPENLNSINSRFMYNCSEFAQPLTIPASVNYYGSTFMYGCDSFIGPLTVSATGNPTDNQSLATQNKNAEMYAFGVIVEGDNALSWKAALPDQSNYAPYRKLNVELPTDVYGLIFSNSGARILRTPEDVEDFASGNNPVYSATTAIFYPKIEELTQITELNNFLPGAYGLTELTGLEHFKYVTAIGDNFLEQASQLTTAVKLPESVTTIGNNFMSYAGQAGLNGFAFPAGVASVGAGAFRYANTSQVIPLPAGVAVPDYYMANTQITELIPLPPDATRIPHGYMYGTQFSGDVTIPSTVTEIGDYFLSQTQFNSPLTLPEGLTSIGDYFLSSCSSFNQPFNLPSSLLTIGNYFLSYDSNFNQPIVLPEGLASIGSYFMQNTSSYAQPMNVPASVTSVGNVFMANNNNFIGPLTVDTAATPQDSWSQYSPSSLAVQNGSASASYRDGIALAGAHGLDWATSSNLSPTTMSRNPRVYTVDGPEGEYIKITFADGSSQIVTSAAAVYNYVNGWNMIYRANISKGISDFEMVEFLPDVEKLAYESLGNGTLFGLTGTFSPGSNVKEVKGLERFKTLKSLGDGFLAQCRYYSADVVVPEGVESIGTNFMINCTYFRKRVVLPTTLSKISGNMLANNEWWTGPIVVNSDVEITNPEGFFTNDLDYYPKYLAGVKIAGPGAVNFRAQIPDSHASGSYRSTYLYDETPLEDSEFGTIMYFTDAQEILTHKIATKEDFNLLTGSSTAVKTITFSDGLSVKSTQVIAVRFPSTDDIQPYTMPAFTGFKRLGRIENFENYKIPGYLSHEIFDSCYSLNCDITLPDSLTNLAASNGGSFMDRCLSYSGKLTIPEGVTQIGKLLTNALSFVNILTIPASVTAVTGIILENTQPYSFPPLATIDIQTEVTPTGGQSLSFAAPRSYPAVGNAPTPYTTFTGPGANAWYNYFNVSPSSGYYRHLILDTSTSA